MSASKLDSRQLKKIIQQRKFKRKEEEEILRNRSCQDIAYTKRMREEGYYPLQLLTQDCWEKIFEDITSPSDLYSLWNTSPVFQDILRGKRLENILFPLVIMHVEHFWSTLTSTSSNNLLLIRQTSKKMRGMVDSLYLNRLDKFGVESDYNRRSTECNFIKSVIPLKFKLRNRDLDRLNEMLDDFNVIIENEPRLFTRSLHVEITLQGVNIEDDEARLEIAPVFLQAFTRLLELCGEQIYQFVFDVWLNVSEIPGQISILRLYQTLHEWIALMPNLNALHLILCWDEESNYANEVVLNEFRQICAKSNVEKLFVKHFQFSSSGFCPPRLAIQFTKGILDSCPKIRVLGIDTTGNNFFHGDKISNSINRLKLESISLIVEEEGFASLKRHINLNLSWPLKSICLKFSEEEIVNLNMLFRYLEAFPLLTSMDLRIPKFFEDRAGYLQLPLVTKVKLSIGCNLFNSNQFSSIDFLLEMERLECISWKGVAVDTEKAHVAMEELIMFQEGKMNLYESNIWDVFPSLGLIEIEDDDGYRIYTRSIKP